MKKTLAGIIIILSLIAYLTTNKVYADGGTSCIPVYGGGVECPTVGEVLIDKKVLNPRSGVFVDNLLISDPKYRPQEIVTFQLIVQNTSDVTFNTVKVTDTLPNFIDYMSLTGPTNDPIYDDGTRVLTFTVGNLGAGSRQVFTLKARVVAQGVLPSEKNVICPVNSVYAKVENDGEGSDQSQFCIEKTMIVPQVPTAGPEDWMLTLTGISMALGSGLILRKKAIIG